MGQDRLLLEALRAALAQDAAVCPPRLQQAMAEAVLGGGARLRPQLCLAVAQIDSTADAWGGPEAHVWTVACALEFLHCASLVHDDLPCFDNATLRRGRPTIHVRFGQAAAVLVGDALMMTAFAQMSRLSGPHAATVGQQVAHAARRMVWGQALENEPDADLSHYHGHKTAALFEAAAVCGAYLAPEGCDKRSAAIEGWRRFGGHVGALYQIADDILDVARARPGCLSDKSAGRDDALKRPNAALRLGLGAARSALERHLHEADAAIVPGPQAAAVRGWLGALKTRLGHASGIYQMEPAARMGRSLVQAGLASSSVRQASAGRTV